jgi:hypothetical protein
MATICIMYWHVQLGTCTLKIIYMVTTYLILVPRSKNAWSYTSTPPTRLRGVVLSSAQ